MSGYTQDVYERIFSHNVDRFREAINMRFVHYTSAEVAMNIIDKKAVWMRNAQTMNDYSELEYGRECLSAALDGDHYKVLEDLIDKNFENGTGLLDDIPKRFHEHSDSTYIACISEHSDKEDVHGRLSMWRAYGGNSGVAIVVNNRPFVVPNEKLGATTYPVRYLSKTEFLSYFDQLVIKIAQNIKLIANDTGFLTDLWKELQTIQYCIKHPGFEEEREWRIVYRPKSQSSAHIPSEIVNVRGTPQMIYKLRLEDIPEADFYGASPGEFIDRIIIGPCAYPGIVRHAFVKKLLDNGVDDAQSKVTVSDIPLRVWF